MGMGAAQGGKGNAGSAAPSSRPQPSLGAKGGANTQPGMQPKGGGQQISSEIIDHIRAGKGGGRPAQPGFQPKGGQIPPEVIDRIRVGKGGGRPAQPGFQPKGLGATDTGSGVGVPGRNLQDAMDTLSGMPRQPSMANVLPVRPPQVNPGPSVVSPRQPVGGLGSLGKRLPLKGRR